MNYFRWPGYIIWNYYEHSITCVDKMKNDNTHNLREYGK